MSRFGRGLRGRKKAAGADQEVTQIADQANLWWTRRDFVQHAVVRTRSRTADGDGTVGPDDRRNPAADAPGFGPVRTSLRRPAQASSSRAATPPAAPPAGQARAADPLAGRSFAEVFTTESLFAEPTTPRGPRPAAVPGPAPTAPAVAPTGAAAVTTAAPAMAPDPAREHGAPEPLRARRRPLAANHPLMDALEHLGLGRDATWSDIQLAYRTMAKLAHPDVTGDDGQAMAQLNAAYNELRDGRSYGLFED